MKDHASRTWCLDPNSEEWRDAARKEWRAKNPTARPKVLIGCRHQDYMRPVMFNRQMDQPAVANPI